MKRIRISLVMLVLGVVSAVAMMAAAGDEAAVRDKTLVVWAAPANLTQKGGSALTIDDDSSHFDGIVFGEIAAGKWMAGSDYYRHTQRDQSTSPAETADAKTFVQLAIVYSGKQVTIYRNGKEYARYEVKEQQAFGRDSVVMMGLRSQDVHGHDASFVGAIDDARVYDKALSAEQIAALKANEPSTPKPIAWWTFEPGKETDQMGRFPLNTLRDGAKIENGQLLLGGRAATLIASAKPLGAGEPPVTPAMPAERPASWLTYHLVHPGPGGAYPGDPNCAFQWNGVYHLHYIYNQKGFNFAHVSSTDLVHWTWHPTVLTPRFTGHGMFSGTGFITKEGKAAIIYHGQGSGRNQVAFALDDSFDNWSKPMPIEPKDKEGKLPAMRHWDPDCWLMGDTYYALSGGGNPNLIKSTDLKDWQYLGALLHDAYPETIGVAKGEDISCANMFKIGNKWMLLCISHRLGCRYYLGDFKDEKYLPEFHAMMSWNGNNYFAPESVLAKDGRRVMWAWLMGLPLTPSGVQSLPRELELPEDGVLRIRPLRELQSLRSEPKQQEDVVVKADSSQKLEGISGNTLELELTCKASPAKEFGLDVLCDKNGGNGLRISIQADNGMLQVGKVQAPFKLKPGEALTLRVFIDKNLVEVFANDRQAAVSAVNFNAENVGLNLFSKGGDTTVQKVSAWKMKSIYAVE